MPHAIESKLLRELLEEKACALVFNHEATGTNAVDIKETSKEAKLKKITLTHLGDVPFVLLPEVGQGGERRYSPLFRKQEGYSHHQACDAVLFFKKGTTLYEVCIELKSDVPKGCEKQFQATEDFMEYTWRVLKSQKQHERLLRTRRRVVLNTKRNDYSLGSKQPTHPKSFSKDGITYIKTKNQAVLTPADFFC
jgi:hypothetical protein